MLKLKPKFDLRRDVVFDILRKEAAVCRVKGEETLTTVSLTRQLDFRLLLVSKWRYLLFFAKACGILVRP